MRSSAHSRATCSVHSPGKRGNLVLTVGDKRLPSDDDAAVRARAEHALLARARWSARWPTA